jgi:hypothetical protein
MIEARALNGLEEPLKKISLWKPVITVEYHASEA